MTRYVNRGLSERVAKSFSAALRAQEPVGGIRTPAELIQVEAFCVAITRQSPEGVATGLVVLPGSVKEASIWCLCNGAGPCVIPEIKSLNLHERIVGHWTKHCLRTHSGMQFPYSRAAVKQGFESAIDSCAVDLARLAEDVPPEPWEWAGTLTDRIQSARGQVQVAQRLMWSIAPPVEAWAALQTPEGFWQSVRSYLKDFWQMNTVLAPCPSWWIDTAPSWDSSVLRVVARTQPRLAALAMGESGSSVLASLRARNNMQHGMLDASTSSPLTRLRSCQQEEMVQSRVALEKAEQSTGREAADVDIGGNTSSADRSVQAPSAVLISPTEMSIRKIAPRKAKCSVSDMLKKDAAWADRLLRGVALLAAGVPSGV